MALPDPTKARPLWENDPVPAAPGPPRPPAPQPGPRRVGPAPRWSWDWLRPRAVAWLRRALAEAVEVARATAVIGSHVLKYSVYFLWSRLASILARRAQLGLGRKAMGQAAGGRPDEPGWRAADRDGQALQRGASILDRGVVPPEAALEYGRAVSAQAASERARRRESEARVRLRGEPRGRWIRFGIGLALLIAAVLLWTRPDRAVSGGNGPGVTGRRG